MPFDDLTRNELQKIVGKARDLLVEEFTSQCQRIYGIQPSGLTIELTKLDHLPQEEQVRANLLRDRIDHLAAGNPSSDARIEAVARMIREQGFTVLNRLCALRMCEDRGLVHECVRSGYESKGFRLYDQAAFSLGGDTYRRYNLFLQLLFDELSVELGILFDRFALTGLLFPGENTLKSLIALINSSKVNDIWGNDEAIGWVYQYFNSQEERKSMREASAAPRNSRELAVRNQFFTPRYVVEFLTDNTLGRIWYEMRKGNTALTAESRFLDRRPDEVFLAPEEKPPFVKEAGNVFSEEVEQARIYVEHRAKKDPRDLRVLDPACGSGHFLLYAFDLLERIYVEAWADLDSPICQVTGRSLRDEYKTLDELRRMVPKLIVEHNLHGIDIDSRAVQIAALALWLRAQKTWTTLSIKVAERPRMTKSNVVTAEPMPGKDEMLGEFIDGLKPRVLGQLVDVLFEKMKLAGEAGSLLKIEEEIKDALTEAKRQWMEAPEPEQQLLFPGIRALRPQQEAFRFDVTGVTDQSFWQQAEERILTALKEYAERADTLDSISRRLFSEDAARGFAFIDLCRRRYDVVLMNPPFGDGSVPSKGYLDETYGDTRGDVYKAFVECFQSRLEPSAMLGIISSRTGFFLGQSEDWRTRIVLRLFRPLLLADLGIGVLDAMVEVAAYVLRNLSKHEARALTLSLVPVLEKLTLDRKERFSLPKWQAARQGLKRHQAWAELEDLEAARFVLRASGEVVRYTPVWPAVRAATVPPAPVFPPLVCIRALSEPDKEAVLAAAVADPMDSRRFTSDPGGFDALPGRTFAYWVSKRVLNLFVQVPLFRDATDRLACITNPAGDDTRYFRCFWELPAECLGRTNGWASLAKGGEFSRYYADQHLVVKWDNKTGSYEGFLGTPHRPLIRPASSDHFFKPGLTYPRRSQKGFSVRILPAETIFHDKGPGIFAAETDLLPLLSVFNSAAYSALLSLQMAFGSYEVGVVQRTPMPRSFGELAQPLADLARRAWTEKQRLDAARLTSHVFVLPALLAVPGNTLRARASEWASGLKTSEDTLVAIQATVDELAFTLYGIENADRPALAKVPQIESAAYVNTEVPEDDEEESDATDSETLVAELLAYAVGACFGRWDIRMSLDPGLKPNLPQPFEPLPVCQPGMLLASNGLPAAPNRIASEAWLRVRRETNSIPEETAIEGPIISDADYKLRMSWDGVLVDDPGFNGSQPHQDDIVRRIREVFELIWGDEAQAIEQEVCAILGSGELRDYFRKPAGFFEHHLKSHTKSRRKAPVFLPLSTQSGSYTLWLYYPRLSEQTPYSCVNDYLDPKLRDIEKDLGRLRATSSSDRSVQRHIDQLVDVEIELKALREQLLRIAALPYKPDRNDGVLISVAPLWELFRYRPWQSALKKCWEDLTEKKYEWAHMALSVWPDRVRKECMRNKSIAIAHGVEKLFRD